MLSDKEIKALEPKLDKKYLVADFEKLFVLVYPSGKKSFVFDYKDPKTRKLKRITLGIYPKMSLKEAREERTKIQYNLLTHNSINEKSSIKENFKELCEKYFIQKNDVLPKTLQTLKSRIYIHCKDILDYQLNQINKNEILDIFEKLKIAKKASVAKKLFNDLNNIFIYAINKDLIENNPMSSIIKKNIIYKAPVRHLATIVEMNRVRQLIGDILDTEANISTKVSTLLSLFTAQRSFSIRSATWSDIDLDKGIWEIPAEKMKMKKKHLVHLSPPCLKILKWYRQVSFNDKLFASLHNKNEIMSDNTIRMMFRRMGYSNEDFTPHGFRSMFSTLCHEHRNEHNLSSDIIELCLAHTDKNSVRSSYNFASNLEERKKLFEWWGEFLCKLEPRLRDFKLDFV
ncbi:tyrosine-type recombinase/integrase [Campylobacter sp. MIT 97-5078]|uniref:tyrosine-type recombinase/integrase n=1 Tax=Campylobacter sp. MIT 97-5078 TaxID=1548153 RepID=UPI000512B8EA|nr:site-specific integrase [Campylobacter sp. MIT 97-5078]KGI57365.1 hypothetical protein LR59_01150 [Campylobacter sp. MIT 97-5078]TQR27453.1 site-specific integrase [Campylobacter sp. MIT 97-5078]